MRQRWPVEAVRQHVDDAVRAVGARTVVTFDAHGVSGHVNHVDTHLGVLAWAAAHPVGADVWVLVRSSSHR